MMKRTLCGLILMLISISFTICTSGKQVEPEARSPITKRCSNLTISGVMISADCFDNDNNLKNSNFDFSLCLHNYGEETLSTSFFLARATYDINDCIIRNRFIICKCHNPDNSYGDCSIPLNRAFFVDKKGNIKCRV